MWQVPSTASVAKRPMSLMYFTSLTLPACTPTHISARGSQQCILLAAECCMQPPYLLQAALQGLCIHCLVLVDLPQLDSLVSRACTGPVKPLHAELQSCV